MERLASVHLAELTRLPDGPGEVAFGTADGASIIFLYGNLVLEAAKAGREDTAIPELVKALDGLLKSAPEQPAAVGWHR